MKKQYRAMMILNTNGQSMPVINGHSHGNPRIFDSEQELNQGIAEARERNKDKDPTFVRMTREVTEWEVF